ncbi:MAG: hypothetical protein II184_06180, partial [Clostridia bacterium]|nr:hypothetical protein [Clostridia bacterium]
AVSRNGPTYYSYRLDTLYAKIRFIFSLIINLSKEHFYCKVSDKSALQEKPHVFAASLSAYLRFIFRGE